MNQKQFSVKSAITYAFSAFYHNPLTLFIIGLLYGGTLHVLPRLLLLAHPSLSSDWEILDANQTLGLGTGADIQAFFAQYGLVLATAALLFMLFFSVLHAGFVQTLFDVYDTKKTHPIRLFSWFSSFDHAYKAIGTDLLLLLAIIPIGAVGLSWIMVAGPALNSILPAATPSIIKNCVLAVPFTWFTLYCLGRIMLTKYALVGDDTSITNAFKQSISISRGNVLRIGVLIFLYCVMTLPFFALFGQLGVKLITPFAGIILGLAYTYAYRTLSN